MSKCLTSDIDSAARVGYAGAMYEQVSDAHVLSCTACKALCVIASLNAQKILGEHEIDKGGDVIPGMTRIVVRRGRTDMRCRRTVNGGPGSVKLANGEIISIREYPYLCDDCYEDGGSKLDASWERVHPATCRCGKLFRRFSDGSTMCTTCRTEIRRSGKHANWSPIAARAVR